MNTTPCKEIQVGCASYERKIKLSMGQDVTGQVVMGRVVMGRVVMGRVVIGRVSMGPVVRKSGLIFTEFFEKSQYAV